MSQTIRVLIVDDHAIVREGLHLILETADTIKVVGEAADGVEALEMVARHEPDVVLMDIQMPRMDGLTAIKELQRDHPHVAIIILTTFNEGDLVMQGLQAGALSFLLKDTSRENLLDTIHAAAKGETLLKPDIVKSLLGHPAPAGNVIPANPSHKQTLLSKRELEVLKAVAAGETNKTIAKRLAISERTVKAHLISAYNKLGVNTRAAAIAIAVQKGWLESTSHLEEL